MCINFRILNKKTESNAYLIPQIDDILDHLCKAQVFSKTDFIKAWYQATIEPSHMQKTTFLMKYR